MGPGPLMARRGGRPRRCGCVSAGWGCGRVPAAAAATATATTARRLGRLGRLVALRRLLVAGRIGLGLGLGAVTGASELAAPRALAPEIGGPRVIPAPDARAATGPLQPILD